MYVISNKLVTEKQRKYIASGDNWKIDSLMMKNGE